MNPLRSARDRLGALPGPLRATLAGALVLGGLLLAWRSFLANGNGCAGTDTVPVACASWEAWYRWPGTALGILAASGGAVVLGPVREAPASRPRRRQRR